MTSAVSSPILHQVAGLLCIETEKEPLDFPVQDGQTFQSTIQTLKEDVPKCLTLAHTTIPKDLRKSLVKLGAREMRFIHCTIDEDDAMKIAFADSIRKVSFQGCTLTKPFDKQVQEERLESLGILKTKDRISVFNPVCMEKAEKMRYAALSKEFLAKIDAPASIKKIEFREPTTLLVEQMERGNRLIAILREFTDETSKQVKEISRDWAYVHPLYYELGHIFPKMSMDRYAEKIKNINTLAYEKAKSGICICEEESMDLMNELTDASNKFEREIDKHKNRRLLFLSCGDWEEYF